MVKIIQILKYNCLDFELTFTPRNGPGQGRVSGTHLRISDSGHCHGFFKEPTKDLMFFAGPLLDLFWVVHIDQKDSNKIQWQSESKQRKPLHL